MRAIVRCTPQVVESTPSPAKIDPTTGEVITPADTFISVAYTEIERGRLQVVNLWARASELEGTPEVDVPINAVLSISPKSGGKSGYSARLVSFTAA